MPLITEVADRGFPVAYHGREEKRPAAMAKITVGKRGPRRINKWALLEARNNGGKKGLGIVCMNGSNGRLSS